MRSTCLIKDNCQATTVDLMDSQKIKHITSKMLSTSGFYSRATIVLCISMATLEEGSTLSTGCIIHTGKPLHCSGSLPTTIPDGVKEVVLSEFPPTVPITRDRFDKNGWNSITSLSIIS